jgi:hypothetical protein
MTAYHPTGHDDPGHNQPRHPGEDEWGFFDPERHGLAAVRARIGAMPSPEPPTGEDEQARRRSRRLSTFDSSDE